MTARWITADVFDGLATLNDGSVDLVVTSPPFLALRSYLPADHPDKGKEIGSEPTPAAFIDVMLAVTAELRRVLAPHGSICIELGDTYAGSFGSGDQRTHDANGGKSLVQRGGLQPIYRDLSEWPLPKSKTLIPELYRLALAYGINPLTGAESPAGRWRVRNVVTWCRPNPPVGALGDKWRPATSDIVIACTSDKRYWDDIATRRPVLHPDAAQRNAERGPTFNNKAPGDRSPLSGDRGGSNFASAAGAPLLDYWEIPPGGYPGSHYAVYPPALVEPLIKAMAPPKVCQTCGEPSRRIVEVGYVPDPKRPGRQGSANRRDATGTNERGINSPDTHRFFRADKTLGWSECGHDNWRPAHILDPFAGSGTTGVVGTGHGHDVTLIDLDKRNAELARERIGPLLFHSSRVGGDS